MKLQGAEPKIIETYSKLTMRDAIEVMRRNPSTIGQISGTESMSALFRNYTNNCIGGRLVELFVFIVSNIYKKYGIVFLF